MKNCVPAAAVLGVATVLWLTSAGVAAATPDVTGMTYAKASAALSAAGLTAAVSTRVGDHKSQSDCVVVNARRESVPQRGDHSTTGKNVLLALNCYATEASATSPGFSAASPEGKADAAAAAAAKKPGR